MYKIIFRSWMLWGILILLDCFFFIGFFLLTKYSVSRIYIYLRLNAKSFNGLHNYDLLIKENEIIDSACVKALKHCFIKCSYVLVILFGGIFCTSIGWMFSAFTKVMFICDSERLQLSLVMMERFFLHWLTSNS